MRISKYLFCFFTLFVVLADELFYAFRKVMGVSLESGMKSREAIAIATIAYIVLLVDLIKGRISRTNIIQFISLFIILVFYVLTGLSYPHSVYYDDYTSQLLVYGALCVPSAYVGMKVAKGGYDDHILKLLPIFLLIISLIVGYSVFNSSLQERLLGQLDDDVFNYQNSSYYLSFCAVYSVFYVFFYKRNSGRLLNTIVKTFIIVLIIICSIGCILGGGRGAFVYLVVISAYMVYRIIGKRNDRRLGFVFLLIGIASALFYFANHFEFFQSVCASRVAELLITDETRMDLWGRAINSFMDSPVFGHGLGSVWWEVGFYSHNFLSDLLVETGIVGTLVVTLIIIKCVVRLVRLSKINTLSFFLLLVFMGSLVKLAFSGYWLSNSNLFLGYGFAYGYSQNNGD